ncbi:NAD(P)/FAD-dependent oxidoreductase [Streptomyces sp. NBC_01483]|uniref:NAD(P)/FAD-dependent oxidoreductase n=1 Tax=Streptomyces sp. NBC_01483 TaxID=2903883 RepID=UPI002E338319|nr:FAD-dependent monooxygenase [Streptomyces sp. NBC_01483]
MAESPVDVFGRLVQVRPPERTPVLFDTACVLGGSIAGLLAARVLAGHSRRVLIIERDRSEPQDLPRGGVPQDRQVHGILPGGLDQLERWLPGITAELRDLGAVSLAPDQSVMYVDGIEQLPSRDVHTLNCSRPLLESAVRRRVLALPNVQTVTAQASGLEYDNGAVSAVRYVVDGAEDALDVDFVVDAMGRASKLSDWVEQAGYSRPPLHRVPTGIHYATAMFERTVGPEAPAPAFTGTMFPAQPGPRGLTAGLLIPIEKNQWMVGLVVHGGHQPPRTLEEFRSVCDELPPAFGKAVGGAVTREVLNFRQADNRRRDFVGLAHYPARLVSAGDTVASLNATYGQGMSSAALHASCLSAYLTGEPDLGLPAAWYFDLLKVATDALWGPSAGNGADDEEPAQDAEVSQQQWAMGQLMQASLTDETVADAFKAVAYMRAHPGTLADPALLERAVAVNKSAAPDS